MKVDNIFSLFMFYVTFVTVFPLLRIPGANMTFLISCHQGKTFSELGLIRAWRGGVGGGLILIPEGLKVKKDLGKGCAEGPWNLIKVLQLYNQTNH